MNNFNKYLRIIALVELLLGLIFLTNEIADYVSLPTTDTLNSQFGGRVDLFKYKESCYKYFFLYSLIIITGLSFWINKKIYWGLTHILLITLFFVVTLGLITSSSFRLGVNIFLGVLLLLIFCYLEIKIHNPFILKKIGITKTMRYLYAFGGGVSCVFWLILLLI